MFRISWRLFIATSMACCAWWVAAGQSFHFDHFGPAEGLPQAAVQDIEQDYLNRMWFATRDGLCRFDGMEVEVFKQIPGDSASLPGNHISALFSASDSTLWVGAWKHGVAYYDPNREIFVRVQPTDKAQAERLELSRINTFYEDEDQVIWIGTNRGVFRYATREGRFLPDGDLQSRYSPFPKRQVVDFHRDGAGRLWVAMHQRVAVWDKDHWVTRNFKGFIWQIVEDKGKILPVTVEPLKGYLTLAGDSLLLVPKDLNCNANERGNKRVLVDSKGRRWMATANGLDLDLTGKCIMLKNDPSDPHSLRGNSILCLFEDRNGTIWVGTNGFGVSYYNEKSNLFGLLSGLGQPDQRLSHDFINSIGPMASENKIYIGTYKGLDLFDRTTGTVERNIWKSPHPGNQNQLVKSIFKDEKTGTVWLGKPNGLYRMDSEQKAPVWVTKPLPYQITQDDNGNLLTLTGSDISVLEGDSLRVLATRHQITGTKGIYMTWIFQSPIDHQFWVGTDAGIFLCDPQFSSCHRLPISTGKRSELPEPAIKCIVQDSKGQIWIGTEGQGFARWLPNEKAFEFFDTNDGLPNNVVYGILEDDLGYCWLSTNRGLSRFSHADTSFLNYEMQDGLQSNEFNTGAFFKDDKGWLYFGGISGVSYFDPIQFGNREETFYSSFLTGLEINRQMVRPGEGSVLPQSVSVLNELDLCHDENNFSFHFGTANYFSPKSIRYRYQLEGFDQDWTEPTDSRVATYTNVPPGTYTFRLTNSATPGVWNPNETTIQVHIGTAWWATWWFRILLLVGLIFLLLALYKTRVSFLEAQRKLLEAGVKERTNIISEKNKEITAQAQRLQEANQTIDKANASLKQLNGSLERKVAERTRTLTKANLELDRFVYSVSHDIRAPLSSILGLVELMKLEVDGDKQEMDKYISKVQISAERLDQFTSDILAYSKNSRLEIQRELIDFEAVIKAVLEDLSFVPGATKVKSNVKVITNGPFYTDISRVQILLRNMISNSVRHQAAHDPWLHITVESDSHEAHLVIEDNGEGMSKEVINKIFDMFYRGSQNSGASGLGLYIVKETIDRLNGSIQVESALGKGTRFTLVLPNEVRRFEEALDPSDSNSISNGSS